MRRLFAKHKADLVFALLTGISVILLFLPPAPALAARTAVIETFASSLSVFGPMPVENSPETISALKAENARLTDQLNRQSWSAAGDVASGRYDGVAAALIACPDYRSRRLYILNKGSDDHVEPGAGVVANGIGVGRIIAVGRRTSLLAPLGDPESRIPARILEPIAESNEIEIQSVVARSAGAVEGDDGIAWLKYIPRTETVNAGQTVATSGMDGAFPSGVLLGTVKSVKRTDAAFHDIVIEPALPIDAVRDVVILKRMRLDDKSMPGGIELRSTENGMGLSLWRPR
ncbi:MAG: rod shape-determining protein MreC [Planctomycetota bacterium]